MAFLADFVAEGQRSKANAFVGMQIKLKRLSNQVNKLAYRDNHVS
jgi:uncharacterized protein YbjQ (UPF0145 family)